MSTEVDEWEKSLVEQLEEARAEIDLLRKVWFASRVFRSHISTPVGIPGYPVSLRFSRDLDKDMRQLIDTLDAFQEFEDSRMDAHAARDAEEERLDGEVSTKEEDAEC